MITLYEVKEWLRLDLDSDYEDNIIEGLISVSSSVIEIGTGVTEENETPPNEYFSWCNSDKGKHTCTDGLTNEISNPISSTIE